MTEITNGNQIAPPRTFTGAIEACFTRYATFRVGRASRSEYWWFQLFGTMAIWGIEIANAATTYVQLNNEYYSDTEPWLAVVIVAISEIFVLIPALAVGARRLHDIGRSGWWQLIMLTGIGYIVLLFWWGKPGDVEPNKYEV